MFNSKSLILFSLIFLLTNCSGPEKNVSRDFDPKAKIQVIETMPNYYVYAQNDQVFNSTLKSELTKMNPEWGKEFAINQNLNFIQEASFLLQVASLFACISGAARDDNKVMDIGYGAFCGASAGFGLLSIHLDKKMRKNTHKVITEYNSRY